MSEGKKKSIENINTPNAVFTVEDAVEAIGFGRFQIMILAFGGLFSVSIQAFLKIHVNFKF